MIYARLTLNLCVKMVSKDDWGNLGTKQAYQIVHTTCLRNGKLSKFTSSSSKRYNLPAADLSPSYTMIGGLEGPGSIIKRA